MAGVTAKSKFDIFDSIEDNDNKELEDYDLLIEECFKPTIQNLMYKHDAFQYYPRIELNQVQMRLKMHEVASLH